MRPASLSYGPVDPKDWPPASIVREVMVTLVTSADVASGRSKTHNSTKKQRRIAIYLQRDSCSIEVSAKRWVKRSTCLTMAQARGPVQEDAQRPERRSGSARTATAEDTLPIVRDGIHLTVTEPQHAAAKQFPAFTGPACGINRHRQINSTKRRAIRDVEQLLTVRPPYWMAPAFSRDLAPPTSIGEGLDEYVGTAGLVADKRNPAAIGRHHS